MRVSPGTYTTCTVEGCDRPYKARGFCNMHYGRVYKTGAVGAAESHYTGRGSITVQGYRRLRKYNEDGNKIGWKYIHRDVMERNLGRPLASHETVHHLNGDREDNRIENLELWSSRHGPGQRVADKLDFARSLLTEYGINHSTFSASEAISGLMAAAA